MVIKFNNDLFSIFKMEHRTPGNLRGFVQVKMRNFRTGSMIEHRFSSEDRVEKASLEEHEMEFLYDDGEYFHFMNTENFEQMHLTTDILGDATSYLIPQLKVNVEFYEGKPISVELPPTVDLTVVETEPGLKGASVSNVTKPAKLETGLVVQVPPFINEGEKIRVSTAEAMADYATPPVFSLAGLEAEASARTRSSSSSGSTVRRSSTSRSFSILAMTGGEPARSVRSAATASPRIARSHVGKDCSGVEPPPATLRPSINSSDGTRVRTRSARERISSARARTMRRAGISTHRSNTR